MARLTRRAISLLVVLLTGLGVLPTVAQASGSEAGASEGEFVAITPTRLLDTRIGLGGPKALVAGGSSLAVAVAGRGAIPSSGVSTVVMTVTVVRPRAAGHLTVSGHDLPLPLTPSVRFDAGQTAAALVVVTPGSDGAVNLLNGSAGGGHLLIDVSGYHRIGQPAAPGGFARVSADRVWDTQVGRGGPRTLVAGRSSVSVAVAGLAGVPGSGVAAVVLVVTVESPAAAGHVTVSGHRTPRPATSNVNFTAGRTASNRVVVQPGADGKVDLFNGSAGHAYLAVEVSGYYPAPDQYASSQGGSGQTWHNPSETMLTPANVSGLRPAWNANPVAVSSASSAAVVDGIAYIPGHVPGRASSQLLAAQAQTGRTLWTAPLPDCGTAKKGLTISGGMAFLGCDHQVGGSASGAFLVAVDLASHRQVWARRVGPGQAPTPSAADGMVFVTSQTGSVLSVLGLDARTGRTRFTIPSAGPAQLGFAARDGRLVISASPFDTASGVIPGFLRVYDDRTGALLWTGTGDHVFGALTMDAGHILVTDYDTSVSEWSEGGCGASECAERWTTSLKPADDPRWCRMQAGAADGYTLAVTVQCDQSGAVPASSRIAVVNESTGAIANTIRLPAGTLAAKGAVRSGGLLWLPVTGNGSVFNPSGIQAFAADCEVSCQPLVNLVGNGAGQFPEPSIAVAAGTVLVQTWMTGPAMLPEVLAFRL